MILAGRGAGQESDQAGTKVGDYWNTLGVAHYRAGAWQTATTCLERSMTLRKGGDAYDWLFLAMAHWQLGHQRRPANGTTVPSRGSTRTRGKMRN